MPAQLATRRLGRSGPAVSALGFGAMGLSGVYGAVESDEERFAVLDRAYDLGVTSWDSADVYQDSEELLGKWFTRTGKRDDIFLATKFSLSIDANGNVSQRSDPEYVREACDRSLGRLGVGCIDLYYCHRYVQRVFLVVRFRMGEGGWIVELSLIFEYLMTAKREFFVVASSTKIT